LGRVICSAGEKDKEKRRGSLSNCCGLNNKPFDNIEGLPRVVNDIVDYREGLHTVV
jgi:hypothetical protein